MQITSYDSYRNSGQAWLGNVPSHWKVVPNIGAFTEIDDKNHPNEEMLSVTIGQGVIKQSTLLLEESLKDGSRIDKSSYKLVLAGDIAYNKMRAWQGAIGASEFRGIISPAYVVQRPKQGNVAEYLHYLLRTPAFAKEAEKWSYGITSDMWSLRPEHFKRITCCLPPPEEQAAIVRFLDHADEQIQRYITAKERLIALLEEQRRALIHQAVTRGLDPNVQLKPSGVEWLGDIPEHWETLKIQDLSHRTAKSFTDGDWIESPYITTEGIRLIQTGNIGVGEYIEKGHRYISPATFEELNCTELVPGDILICRLGEPVARACLAPELGRRMITSVDVCIVKPRTDLNPKFTIYSMSSRQYLNWIGSLVRGSTRDRISRFMLGKFVMPLPPHDEQNAITDQLDKATSNIDGAVSRARRQIDLLEEYRIRLIGDVVTGKLDVREAVANLPDL